MAKIQRATQKIFASTAQSQQITAFGTAMAASPTYTTDVNQIMNANFLAGWASALMPDMAPYEEDTNGVIYAVTKQLAYLFQQGIPEWDAGTEYNAGSLVQVVENNELVIKKSKVDLNIGNATTNTTYWEDYYSSAILAQKANVGLDNVAPVQAFKNSVLQWLQPDYTAGIAISSNFVAPSDGWICVDIDVTAGQASLSVNGNLVLKSLNTNSVHVNITITLPVAKNDVVTWSGSSQSDSRKFFPMKGSN